MNQRSKRAPAAKVLPVTTPTTDTSTVQLAVRFEPHVVARLEALARRLSRPGLSLSRADALRIALMTGLEHIEREGDSQ
ncbi:MAG: hypothetical protein Q8Q09_26375 [Deltaproteobacteria bacterium]|nr:hypothetical protein [Deltaproteobacteria bacterium]